MNIIEKIQSIINKANDVTGQHFTDLTSASSELMSKYNKGGEFVPIWDDFASLDDLISFAHRGICTSNSEYIENTMPMYELAADRGYRAVECDVYFTSDGYPVICHDATFFSSTQGTLMFSSITYEYFLENREMNGGHVLLPTLEELLAMCARRKISLYLEIKGGTQSFIENMVDLTKEYNMESHIIYGSFTSKYVQYVKQYDPSLRIAILSDSYNDSLVSTIEGLKTDSNVVYASLKYTAITRERVQTLLSKGINVTTYTDISHGKILELIDYGVKAFAVERRIAEYIQKSSLTLYPDDGWTLGKFVQSAVGLIDTKNPVRLCKVVASSKFTSRNTIQGLFIKGTVASDSWRIGLIIINTYYARMYETGRAVSYKDSGWVNNYNQLFRSDHEAGSDYNMFGIQMSKNSDSSLTSDDFISIQLSDTMDMDAARYSEWLHDIINS